jgi:hypothetical protein
MAVIGKPFFVVPIALSGMVTDSADPGHPVHALGEHRDIGTTWKTTTTGDHWVRGQITAPLGVDFCAVVAANASPAAQIRVRLGATQAEVDGVAPYDSGVLDFIATTPADLPEDGLYHSHLEIPAAQTATWFRIDISGQTGIFEAAMLVLGKRITPSHFYDLDYEQGHQDLGKLDVSRWGIFEEEPGLTWRTLDFVLNWQSEAELESDFRRLQKHLNSRGICYCCFDPTDSSYRHARTYMGVARKPMAARGRRKPRTFAQEFSLLSYI